MKKTKAVQVIGILVMLIFIFMINACSHQPVSEAQTRKEMLHKLQDYLGRIPDSDRRERLLSLLDTMAAGLAELNWAINQFSTEAKRLNADYDATRADFHKLTAKFNASRQMVQQRLLTTHFEIKALTTEKEWADIAKMEKKAVNLFLRQNLLDPFSKPKS